MSSFDNLVSSINYPHLTLEALHQIQKDHPESDFVISFFIDEVHSCNFNRRQLENRLKSVEDTIAHIRGVIQHDRLLNDVGELQGEPAKVEATVGKICGQLETLKSWAAAIDQTYVHKSTQK